MSSPGSPQLTLVIIYVFQPLIYEFCRLVWLNGEGLHSTVLRRLVWVQAIAEDPLLRPSE